MLPDLRIVIAAVISTFVLTVGVGFFASSRLISEPRKSTDSIAAMDATPVNRIALSWPAPTRQPEPLALDFAVTAKALRNPVRDVSGEASVAEPAPEPHTPPVRTTATDLSVPPAWKQAAKPPEAAAPAPIQAAPRHVDPAQVDPVNPAQVAPAQPAPTETTLTEVAPIQAAPTPVVVSEMPKLKPGPAPEPDIRVAVQYPPILEFPPELQAPSVPAPAIAAVEPPAEAPATTGSIAQPSKSTEVEDDLAPSPGKDKEPEPQVASRPEPAEANVIDDPEIENVPIPTPAPKILPAKAAPKKAAAKKAPRRPVRRPVRRAAPTIPPTVPNFFNLFTLQQPPR